MSLHEVTYWTVECDAPGCARSMADDSDYSAWSDKETAAGQWQGEFDESGVILDDGTAYCWEHIPADICPRDSDHQHEWEPIEGLDGQIEPGTVSCRWCGTERSKADYESEASE